MGVHSRSELTDEQLSMAGGRGCEGWLSQRLGVQCAVLTLSRPSWLQLTEKLAQMGLVKKQTTGSPS